MTGVIRKTIRKTAKKPRGKPFAKGNEYAAKPGEVRNPTGESGATSASAALRKIGVMKPPDDVRAKMKARLGYEPQTWHEVSAMGQFVEAAKGNTAAAKEIRQATEGDTLHTPDWRQELRDAGIDPDEAQKALIEQLRNNAKAD